MPPQNAEIIIKFVDMVYAQYKITPHILSEVLTMDLYNKRKLFITLCDSIAPSYPYLIVMVFVSF